MENERQKATRTVKVIVRHSADCKDKSKGSEWRKCTCRKSLLIYEGEGTGRNRRVSAKTRSWEAAEKEAQRWRDSWDPIKRELAKLKAEKEQQQVRIEDALCQYLADMEARLGDNGTLAQARSLFGVVNPETKAVTRAGHFLAWIDHFNKTQPAERRLTYIADITPTHLTGWRATWTQKFKSDLTRAQRWIVVGAFFNFCADRGWIENNPAQKIGALRAKKGNRTAIFTDDQYTAILKAVPLCEPENVPAATRKAWQRRLTAFLELMRWSGTALIDAVQFRPELIDTEGVLRYRRQKSGELATVPLPAHVLALLRDLPLERDSVGAGQPFRSKDVVPETDTHKWNRRLTNLFKEAGLKSVRTEIGTQRSPHPHMLRDTFAVWHLRHGTRIHTLARMLGHAKVSTTERAYLPWVKELEDAHIADARKALAHVQGA